MFEVPKFSSKDDPELWIYRYNKAATMNKWDDKTKLYYVDNCFKENLQLWFMQQDFKSWLDFKTSFLLKFARKVNFSKLISHIINFKMTNNERILEYITRFEDLRNKYLLELAKRKQQHNLKANLEKRKEDGSSKAEIDSIDQGAPVDLHITELGFLNYFINGIQSKSMKRFIRTEKPDNLKDAYSILQDVYGPEDYESQDEIE